MEKEKKVIRGNCLGEAFSYLNELYSD